MPATLTAIIRSPVLFTLMGRMTQLATQIALVLIVPKVLLPEAYVEFSLVMPLGLLGASLVFGWLIRAIYRHVHELLAEDDDRCRQTVYFYYAIASLLLLAVFVLASQFTGSIYRLVPVLLVATALKMAALGALNAAEKHKPFFYAHLSFAIVLTVFLVLCATGSMSDLERNLLIYAGLDGTVALLIWRHLRVITWPPLPSFDSAVARRYFIYGLPLVIQNVAVWVISLSDRYLLKLWEPTDSIASYILGYQLASSTITIPITFAMTVIFPRAIRIDKDTGQGAALDYTNRMLGYYVRYAAVIAILGCAIVIPFKYFVYPDYEFHPDVMVIIVLAHVIAGLTPFLSKEFELNGRTLVITKAVGLGAVTNVGLNLALIPALGLIGAALATLVAYGVSVSFLYRSKTHTGRIV